jgi:hypothetical protein
MTRHSTRPSERVWFANHPSRRLLDIFKNKPFYEAEISNHSLQVTKNGDQVTTSQLSSNNFMIYYPFR